MLPTPRGSAADRPDLFSERAFAHYWRILLGPVVVALAGIVWASWTRTSFTTWHEFVVLLALFFTLALLAWRSGLASRMQFMAVNMLAGAVMGFGLAVNRLLQQDEFYLVFNLLAEPARVSLLGGIIAWLLGTAIRLTHIRVPLPRLRFIRSRHA